MMKPEFQTDACYTLHTILLFAFIFSLSVPCLFQPTLLYSFILKGCISLDLGHFFVVWATWIRNPSLLLEIFLIFPCLYNGYTRELLRKRWNSTIHPSEWWGIVFLELLFFNYLHTSFLILTHSPLVSNFTVCQYTINFKCNIKNWYSSFGDYILRWIDANSFWKHATGLYSCIYHEYNSKCLLRVVIYQIPPQPQR